MKYENVFTKEDDILNLRKAGEISSSILKELRDSIRAGISAGDINDMAEELCTKNDVIPSFKGVPGPKGPFEYAVCISINDEVLHGIPHRTKIFKAGDIVKVDFGIIYQGFYTDHCVTVNVGSVSPIHQRLISTAKLCIDSAVKEAIVGNTVGDISYVLENISNMAGFKFVTSYCGHGIGKSLHESPEVSSWGDRGAGPRLIEGMVLCVENQITTGSARLKLADDGWTLKTVDGSFGAMFEHMVIVGKKSPEILTLL